MYHIMNHYGTCREVIVTRNTTSPWIFSCFASGVYSGCEWLIRTGGVVLASAGAATAGVDDAADNPGKPSRSDSSLVPVACATVRRSSRSSREACGSNLAHRSSIRPGPGAVAKACRANHSARSLSLTFRAAIRITQSRNRRRLGRIRIWRRAIHVAKMGWRNLGLDLRGQRRCCCRKGRLRLRCQHDRRLGRRSFRQLHGFLDHRYLDLRLRLDLRHVDFGRFHLRYFRQLRRRRHLRRRRYLYLDLGRGASSET